MRVDYDYKVGEKITLLASDPNKMEPPRQGPYTIVQVHANGNVSIGRGATTQRVNIHQITPYKE